MLKKITLYLYFLKIFLIDILNILLIFLIFVKNNLISLEDKSNIIVIRFDALGDIILSLHQSLEIKKKFSESKIIFICQKQYVEFVKNLDIFDEIVPIEIDKFTSSFFYKLNFFSTLNKCRYKYIFNTMYSRTLISDLVVLPLSSLNKVAFFGDTFSQRNTIKKITNYWYHNLINYVNPENKWNHEIITNNFYLKYLNINVTPEIFKFKINNLSKFKLNFRYFVIFPGSSNTLKNWKPQKFIAISKLIYKKYNLIPIVCGGHSEISLSKNITIDSEEVKWFSLVGKTNVNELIEVIRNAEFLITNDTSAVHIAESVTTKSFCILGGGHFGRFLPYKQNQIDSVSKSIYKKLDCFNCKWKCKFIDSKSLVYPCIDNITVSDVMSEIDLFMQSH